MYRLLIWIARKRIDKINIFLQVRFYYFSFLSQFGLLQEINLIYQWLSKLLLLKMSMSQYYHKIEKFSNTYNSIDLIAVKIVIEINMTDGRRILQPF